MDWAIFYAAMQICLLAARFFPLENGTCGVARLLVGLPLE